jgi:hypothetical protein
MNECLCAHRGRDNVVDIVTRLQAGRFRVKFSTGVKHSPPPPLPPHRKNVENGSCAQLACFSVVPRGSSWSVKHPEREACRLPSYSVESENEWSFNSVYPCAFIMTINSDRISNEQWKESFRVWEYIYMQYTCSELCTRNLC